MQESYLAHVIQYNALMLMHKLAAAPASLAEGPLADAIPHKMQKRHVVYLKDRFGRQREGRREWQSAAGMHVRPKAVVW